MWSEIPWSISWNVHSSTGTIRLWQLLSRYSIFNSIWDLAAAVKICVFHLVKKSSTNSLPTALVSRRGLKSTMRQSNNDEAEDDICMSLLLFDATALHNTICGRSRSSQYCRWAQANEFSVRSRLWPLPSNVKYPRRDALKSSSCWVVVSGNCNWACNFRCSFSCRLFSICLAESGGFFFCFWGSIRAMLLKLEILPELLLPELLLFLGARLACPTT